MTPAKPLVESQSQPRPTEGGSPAPTTVGRSCRPERQSWGEAKASNGRQAGPRAGAARPRGGGHEAVEGVRLSQGPPERPEHVGTWADPWGLGGCTEKQVGDRTFWFLQITAEEELQACDSLWLPPVASGPCQGVECQGVQGPQTPGEGSRCQALVALGFLPVCPQGWRLRKARPLRSDARASQCPL